jgi:hypothetical protein
MRLNVTFLRTLSCIFKHLMLDKVQEVSGCKANVPACYLEAADLAHHDRYCERRT